MSSRNSNEYERIDPATSAAICKAIADRLRQSLAPERPGLPTALQHLLDQLRLQDDQDRR